jgi:TRAP-type mannitol/chloroaromatic compound transport system permease small subunit
LVDSHSNNISKPIQLTDEERAVLGRMTTNEADDNVRVTFSTYRRYIMDYFGGWKFIILSNFTIIAFTQCKLYNDYLLGLWSQNTSSGEQDKFYFYAFMIIGFSFLIGFFVYLRAAAMLIFS